MKEFEIRKNGKLITLDELREQAVQKLVDVLDDMASDDLLEIYNYYREENDEPILREFNEDDINEALEDWAPWDILNTGCDVSCPYDYFYLNHWGDDICFTDDVADGLDAHDVASWIIEEDEEGGYSRRYLDYEGKEVLDAYEAARVKLESLSKYQKMMDEVLVKYKNCEADQYDLVYVMEKIARNCDITEREGK